MDCLEAIKARRSIRRFKDRLVEKEKILEILEAARLAPSAGNLQPLRMVVVNEKKLIEAISTFTYEQVWISEAPIALVICASIEQTKRFYAEKGLEFVLQDCSAAIQNILLTATSLGLGACWVGAFIENKIKQLLSIPDEVKVIAIVPIGYADEKPEMPPKIDLNSITYFNAWGKPLKF